MTFEYPILILIIILPFFIHRYLPPYYISRKSIRVPFLSLLRDLSGNDLNEKRVIVKRNKIQRFVISISWVLFVLALMKPVLKGVTVEETKRVREFFVALDLSGSMSSKDTVSGESRLAVAKKILKQFVLKRNKDRIGLIVFGDAAYIQSGLTDDYVSLLSLIDELEVGMAGQSTHLGDAIALGVKTFLNSKSKERIIVLFTDGNDTNSQIPPVKAAEIARDNDVKVYPIVFGNAETIGENPIDYKSLEVIAKTTSGVMFKADNEEELKNSYARINEIEPEEVIVEKYVPKVDIYYYFLIPLYIFAMFLFFGKLIKGSSRSQVV